MLLFVSLIAAAQVSAQPPAQVEKKVCRQMEASGSIMRKRECHTLEEWAQIDARNRENAERVSRERDSLN